MKKHDRLILAMGIIIMIIAFFGMLLYNSEEIDATEDDLITEDDVKFVFMINDEMKDMTDQIKDLSQYKETSLNTTDQSYIDFAKWYERSHPIRYRIFSKVLDIKNIDQ